MDQQILRDKRGNIIVPFLLYVVVAALAAILIGSGLDQMGAELSVVPLLIGVLVLMLLVLLIAAIVERPAPPVSRGPHAIGQVYTNAPPQIVFGHLQPIVATAGFIPQQQLGTTLQLSKSMNMLSWGTELYLDVRASADRPGLGVVTVLARPKAPFQLTDWGQGKKFASRILAATPGAFPAA